MKLHIFRKYISLENLAQQKYKLAICNLGYGSFMYALDFHVCPNEHIIIMYVRMWLLFNCILLDNGIRDVIFMYIL